jgi:hypothetical protein
MMTALPLLLLVSLSGCVASKKRYPNTLYPMMNEDYFPMPKGTSYTSKKDGHFVSDLYLNEVYETGIEEVKAK